MNSCKNNDKMDVPSSSISAKEILGNPSYRAISYGGYRGISRDLQPSVADIKQDMLLLHALGIRVLRTYNVHLAHASNVLKAIKELKERDSSFEMYVMLGAWIDCKNAWTDQPPIHDEESPRNSEEIATAVKLANDYPDIVKIIAVGNEAMVKWATAYYVAPHIILKWVNHLQQLKKDGVIHQDLWITSSDNFASWGGGTVDYHVPDLEKLLYAVDYVSMHTYPMHDTHYNPDFWAVTQVGEGGSKKEQVAKAMNASLAYAQHQYQAVRQYMDSLGLSKMPLHIGETGWASISDGFYGPEGSRACDEYKQKLYHDAMRSWTDDAKISCFFFEAFDEPWKDAGNPAGSENYFGLFTKDGQAKYAIWDQVDKGIFEGLKRGNRSIEKTYGGNLSSLLEKVDSPPLKILVEQN